VIVRTERMAGVSPAIDLLIAPTVGDGSPPAAGYASGAIGAGTSLLATLDDPQCWTSTMIFEGLMAN
jgi:hypothetical protein